jgi:hypothetical protein
MLDDDDDTVRAIWIRSGTDLGKENTHIFHDRAIPELKDPAGYLYAADVNQTRPLLDVRPPRIIGASNNLGVHPLARDNEMRLEERELLPTDRESPGWMSRGAVLDEVSLSKGGLGVILSDAS